MAPQGLFALLVIIYSVILHEIAHGYAALKFGDRTAESMGRLTLDPVPHIDPVGTIIFPLLQYLSTGHVLLGWAKPVPVNVLNLEPRPAADIVVSIAGVFVNFLIAVAMAIVLGLSRFLPFSDELGQALFAVIWGNIGLMVFNLLPIPPLDGSHVAKYFLPPAIRAEYEQIGFNGQFILLLLIATGSLRPITGPVVQAIVFFLIDNISAPLAGR